MSNVTADAQEFVEKLSTAVDQTEENFEYVKNNLEPLGTVALGEMLELLRELIDRLESVDWELAQILSKRVPRDSLIPLGTGNILEGTATSPSKKWNHKLLSHVVAEKIMEKATDPETGAIDDPVSVLLTRVFDYVQPSYWRVQKLEGLGIDAKRYYDKGESKPKLNIIKSGVPRRPWRNDDSDD